MAKTGCICRGRTKPFPELPQYPTLAPGGDPVKLLHENGYFVVRGLFSQQEVEQNKAEISSIVQEWYAEFQKSGEDGKDWETTVNRLPAWKEGRIEPENPEMGIRKLYRMTVRNHLFARMCRHDKVRCTPVFVERARHQGCATSRMHISILVYCMYTVLLATLHWTWVVTYISPVEVFATGI